MQMKHKQVKSNTNTPKCKQSVNILGVDDSPICQFALEDVIKTIDSNAKVVGSGKEAVNEVIHSGKRYHIVITDLNMPEMDGYEVATQLRAYAVKNKMRILIYAHTASEIGMVEDKCAKAGFDGVVIKPVSADAIRSIIEENFK